MRQTDQIQELKKLTGADFRFVPSDINQYRVASYVADISAKDINRLKKQLATMNYVVHATSDGDARMTVVDSVGDMRRIWALSNVDDTQAPVSEYITPIGVIGSNPVYLEPLPTDKPHVYSPVVGYQGRAVVVVNVNGARLPFYVSSGMAGKDAQGVSSGRWYPLMGISTDVSPTEQAWFNKMRDMNKNPFAELDTVVQMLNKKFNPIEHQKMAMVSNIPTVEKNEAAFLEIVNASFPEGAANITPIGNGKFKAVPRDLYNRNWQKYLPKVVRQWRLYPHQTFHNIEELKNKSDRNATTLSYALGLDVFAFTRGDKEYFFFNTTLDAQEIFNWLNKSGMAVLGGVQFGHPTIPGFAVLASDITRADNNMTRMLNQLDNQKD